MSVFSIMKKGRQAAKQHKAEQAEKQRQEEAKPAYRHVPTHAAVDAMAGAPSTMREDDRMKIVEQNRRRSAMAASGMGSMGSMMGIGMSPVHMGMPRVNSALSHVSYPSMYANPVVPRSYSYSGGMLPSWEEHGSEVLYSEHHPDMGSGNAKGKGVERVLMVDSGRASRASSKAPSPAGSSNNSTASQDDLEMKTVRHAKTSGPTSAAPAAAPATPTTAASPARDSVKGSPRAAASETEHVHRLHPSQSRRPSDSPPTERYYPPRVAYRQPYSPGSSRPGSASSRGIPPVPALPPMAFGPSLTSSAASTASSRPPSVRNSALGSSGPTTTNSSLSTTPSMPMPARPESPVSPVSSTKSPKVAAAAESPKSAVSAISIPEPQFDFDFSNTTPSFTASPASTTTAPQLPPVDTTVSVVPAPPSQTRNTATRRLSKSGRVVEQETIKTNDVAGPFDGPDFSRTTVSARELPTEFDEDALAATREESPAPQAPTPQKVGRGRLTKSTRAAAPPPAAAMVQSTAKPPKKHRWSLRSKPTPVAT